MNRYVIIGSGAAGIAALETIRQLDPLGDVNVITNEVEGYYSRPGLAYYLTGEIGEKMLYPFNQKDFHSLRVKLIYDQVTTIDPYRHEISLKGGSRLVYDRALIATGAQATKLNIPGSDAVGVVKLDNIQDARQIIKHARKSKTATVVGGGITALELVEGINSRKVKVNYFLRGDRYWSNVLDKTESKIIEQRLQHEGINIHYNTEIAEIKTNRGQVVGVQTLDGRHIKCDLLAVAIGIRPRIELAKKSGITTGRGILVNEYLQTNVPDIFAAGDVAQVYDPLIGEYVLDSLWGPARNQGTIAGKNMTGNQCQYRKPIAFNVTRLANLTTTIIGTVGRGVDMDMIGIARGDSETWRKMPDAIASQEDFDVNRLRVLIGQNTLIGAVIMGDQTLSRPLQKLISEQINIAPYKENLLSKDNRVADVIANIWLDYHERKSLAT